MKTKQEKTVKQKDYEVLPEIVEVKGTGIPHLKTRLVDRTNRKAFYRRDDGVYEVFAIKIIPAHNVFERVYPRAEKYPGNEDFGFWAECFGSYEAAKKYYHNLGLRSLKKMIL